MNMNTNKLKKGKRDELIKKFKLNTYVSRKLKKWGCNSVPRTPV